MPTGEWPTHWPPLLRRLHAARGSDARTAMPRCEIESFSSAVSSADDTARPAGMNSGS